MPLIGNLYIYVLFVLSIDFKLYAGKLKNCHKLCLKSGKKCEKQNTNRNNGHVPGVLTPPHLPLRQASD